MNSLKCLVAFAIFAVGLTGCISTKGDRRIAIGNSTATDIVGVSIEHSDGTRQELGDVPSDDSSLYTGLARDLLGSARVVWSTAEGENRSVAVDFGEGLPDGFIGRVVLQIESDDEIKVFVVPSRKGGESLIPWSSSGDWDGSVMPFFSE